MHDAYTPTFFTRYNRPLRGVMIDNKTWFAANDIARLLSFRYPHSIHHRFFSHEVRTIRLAYSTGSEEEVVMLSEAALYKALVRLKDMALAMDGQRFALSAGMQTNAEIWLGDRTVMEYLLSPVRKAWHEAGRER